MDMYQKITTIKTKQYFTGGGYHGPLKWVAWFQDDNKNGKYEGFGDTEKEAIGDLINRSAWFNVISFAK